MKNKLEQLEKKIDLILEHILAKDSKNKNDINLYHYLDGTYDLDNLDEEESEHLSITQDNWEKSLINYEKMLEKVRKIINYE